MNCYEELANAIVLQAVTDWRRVVRHPNAMDAKLIREETEKFFLSRWFGILTDLDGPQLLERLKKEECIE